MMPGHPGYPGYPPNPGPYGAPPQPYGAPGPYGAQPGFGPPPPPPMNPMGMYGGYNPMAIANQKNPGLAVALELIFGTCFSTFGVGHIYAGNVGIGLAWMFGYWVVTGINIFLCALLIGFISWPISFIAAAIISSITAHGAAKAFNQRMGLPG